MRVKAIAKKVLGLEKNAKKLNIGCGTDYKKGWINIDNNSDDNIEKLDLNWDLRNPLPYEDNSVDYIFHEHFIEHLTVEEGQSSIKDCLRVLKPGGVLRIATPDLEKSVELYLNPDWKTQPVITNNNLGFVETKAELMNMSFRAWGHKYIYDWEELARRLKQAGSDKFEKCEHSKSAHADLCNLETRQESVLIAEVTK